MNKIANILKFTLAAVIIVLISCSRKNNEEATSKPGVYDMGKVNEDSFKISKPQKVMFDKWRIYEIKHVVSTKYQDIDSINVTIDNDSTAHVAAVGKNETINVTAIATYRSAENPYGVVLTNEPESNSPLPSTPKSDPGL